MTARGPLVLGLLLVAAGFGSVHASPLATPDGLGSTLGPTVLGDAEETLETLEGLRGEGPSPSTAYAFSRSLVDLPADPEPVAPVDPARYLSGLAPGADLAILETLEPQAYQALGQVLGVHQAMQTAVDTGAELDRLEALRASMLAAAGGLAEHRASFQAPGDPVEVCGALYLHLGHTGQQITCDHVVSIAGFGDDLYRNPAGGADTGQARLAIDLGGDDRYAGQAASSAGINGGGHQGAGALIDLAGDDTYDARLEDPSPGAQPRWPAGALNGGARHGTGLLLDTRGNDTYAGTAGNAGINGGAGFGGSGALIDLAGQDERFEGHVQGWTGGVNGGSNDGAGLLFHCGSGATVYTGSVGDRGGVNAGGEQGTGVLVSCGGASTTYSGQAGGGGVNGGASGLAQQVLVHLGGDATFVGQATYGGINGGGFRGSGLLVAGSGDHTYTGQLTLAGGINGGSALGQGILVDLGGSTTYVATSPGTTGANGGAVGPGVGLLLDGGGDDTYDAQVGGEAWQGLVIGPYSLAGKALNGDGAEGGCGLLMDLGGQDRHRDHHEAPWTQDTSRMGPGGCGVRVDR